LRGDEPLLPQSLLDYSIPLKLNADGAEYNSHGIIIIRGVDVNIFHHHSTLRVFARREVAGHIRGSPNK